MSVRMQVDLGGLVMKNPITVASGTFGSGREYAQLWEQSCALSDAATPLSVLGALTTKGVSYDPWEGNEGIRIAESPSGMLNSIGLQNPGVEAFCADDLNWLSRQNVPVIVNVCGHHVSEYARIIQRLEQESAVAAYEVNISCPNVANGGMGFGTDARVAARVVQQCRNATLRPLIVKLSPNVTDITEIARAAEGAGADALSLINTLASMAIDTAERRPVFERGVGGLSGPAIKPVAVYAVYRVYKAVKVPLLGMGGIQTVADALEFFMAGATAVAVGSASFSEPCAAPRLVLELEQWCKSRGVKDIQELIGAAHG